MILVADSGSTKCDWVLIEEDQIIPTTTMGFNPFFHSTALIESKLEENHLLNEKKDSINEVYYYGAGCSSKERNQLIKTALSNHFKNISICVIDEDLNAAAYATCGDQAGIVCILGTGSNSCYYDGQIVHRKRPALGYVLGDEGSGSFFGKQLVSSHLYNQLPEDLLKAFNEYNEHSKESILESVYKKPNANVFLASYMKFISEKKEHPYFKRLVYSGFKLFAETHIMAHSQYKNTKVNFVGSVAYFFEEILHEVAIASNKEGFVPPTECP